MSSGPSALRELLSGERVIAFHTGIARLGGSIAAGVFLSQLLYWSPRGMDSEGWVFKTREEWMDETMLSRRALDGSRQVWLTLGIIEESQPMGTDRTISYRLNFDALCSALENSPYVRSGHMEDHEPVTSNSPDREDVLYTKMTTYSSRRGASAPLTKKTTSKDDGSSLNLASLFVAFKDAGITGPPLPNGEPRHARKLMEKYQPELLAKIWSDIIAGRWGTDGLRASLSFYSLSLHNRIDNWKRDTVNGTRYGRGNHVAQATADEHAQYTASARAKYERQQSVGIDQESIDEAMRIIQGAENAFASTYGNTQEEAG